VSEIKANNFACWIFGYQKFSEEIIRHCICHAKGWEDITRDVKTKAPTEIICHAKNRPDWHSDLEFLRKRACELLDNRQKAIVLDAAFLDGDQIVIGEFKSWGGFEKPHDPTALRKEVRAGEWFPDRFAIHSVLYRKEELPVSRFVFATGLKGATSDIFQVGDLGVEVIDIPSLLKDSVKALPKPKEDWFRALDDAVKKVKTYVETGAMPR
jgi:hypothetical protein